MLCSLLGLHGLHCGRSPEDDDNPENDEDCIVGRYTHVEAHIWDKCEVFYNTAEKEAK